MLWRPVIYGLAGEQTNECPIEKVPGSVELFSIENSLLDSHWAIIFQDAER